MISITIISIYIVKLFAITIYKKIGFPMILKYLIFKWNYYNGESKISENICNKYSWSFKILNKVSMKNYIIENSEQFYPLSSLLNNI